MIELGDRVREVVTGHEGPVTGLVEYMWGCHQALVHYRGADGKPETEWYDLARLEILEKSAVVLPSTGSPVDGPDVLAPRPA
jgi:hypothetical protein